MNFQYRPIGRLVDDTGHFYVNSLTGMQARGELRDFLGEDEQRVSLFQVRSELGESNFHPDSGWIGGVRYLAAEFGVTERQMRNIVDTRDYFLNWRGIPITHIDSAHAAAKFHHELTKKQRCTNLHANLPANGPFGVVL